MEWPSHNFILIPICQVDYSSVYLVVVNAARSCNIVCNRTWLDRKHVELSSLNPVLIVVNIAVLSILCKLIINKDGRLLNERSVSVNFVSVGHKI